MFWGTEVQDFNIRNFSEHSLAHNHWESELEKTKKGVNEIWAMKRIRIRVWFLYYAQ